MDAQTVFAGMNGADLCKIESEQELINKGMNPEEATFYYCIITYLKQNGVPNELLQDVRNQQSGKTQPGSTVTKQ